MEGLEGVGREEREWRWVSCDFDIIVGGVGVGVAVDDSSGVVGGRRERTDQVGRERIILKSAGCCCAGLDVDEDPS